MSVDLFYGFKRSDGTVGTRNLVGIISTVGCANEVTRRIASAVPGSAAFTHHQGCGQVTSDLARVKKVLVGLAGNPNLGAVLLVGLGCEGVVPEEVFEEVRRLGKPADLVVIQKEGGAPSATAKGIEAAQSLARTIADDKRTPQPLSKLVVGVKCGASDATSGLISNPVVGRAADFMVDMGSTVIFGEVTEFLGAEHVLARRCVDSATSEQLLRTVDALENRVKQTGVDMRGGQPSAGNIRGGISTIEEKSLGAVCKAGSRPIAQVCDYGARPTKPAGSRRSSPAWPPREPP